MKEESQLLLSNILTKLLRDFDIIKPNEKVTSINIETISPLSKEQLKKIKDRMHPVKF